MIKHEVYWCTDAFPSWFVVLLLYKTYSRSLTAFWGFALWEMMEALLQGGMIIMILLLSSGTSWYLCENFCKLPAWSKIKFKASFEIWVKFSNRSLNALGTPSSHHKRQTVSVFTSFPVFQRLTPKSIIFPAWLTIFSEEFWILHSQKVNEINRLPSQLIAERPCIVFEINR